MSRLGPPEEDLVGQTLDGRWTVDSRLGAGGMGTVWRGRDRDGTVVAIKVLRADMIHTEDLFKRFAQEASAASRIGNEHIVAVHGFGETRSGAPYYAMELCDGPDLDVVLRDRGPLPWRRAFAIAEQICTALAAAHEAGIIHRDVKPENFVLVEREHEHGRDLVKVLDFGIAKLLDPDLAEVETRTGVSIGTPEYMAPEQGEGSELDGRVDVYGVGVLLYQLITGKVPFSGGDEFEIMQRHMSEVPPPPSSVVTGGLPKIVDAVILQALEKDRDHRYADMQRFARSLHSARHRDDAELASEPEDDDAPARAIPWAAIVVALVVIAAAIAWAMRS
jgi:eukaryotic-like serine/threonine-protein kinase